MTNKKDEIRKNVQEYYTARARQAEPCCTPTQGSPDDSIRCCEPQSLIYPEELLSQLPETEATFSLGCGDPITLANLQPGETVLDLGSGGGLDCFLAARKVGKHGHVIGVDMTPEMIARARNSAARLGITNVEFRQGFLEDLPLEDESVDVIISNCVINLSPDKQRVFQEMHRVLRPGGRLAITDIVSDGELPREWQEDNDIWGSCLGGALEMGLFKRQLEEAGFTQVNIQILSQVGLAEGSAPRGTTLLSAGITARKEQ